MAISTRKTLMKALTSLIEDSRIGTLSAIIANPGGPKPVGQFILVNLIELLSRGKDSNIYTNDMTSPDMVETSSGFREAWFSVKIFREDAMDVAEAIRLNLRKQWARQFMLTFGMALSRSTDIRDLSTPDDAERTQEAQFDVYYNTVQTLTDIVLSIESIEISGMYRGQFNPYDAVIQVENT